ncbi:hypothetical protein ACOMHN_035795 [Nucella lapillus]
MLLKPALVVLLAMVLNTCLGQSALNVTRLHNDLITVTPNVRPMSDLTQPTEVNISFHLTSIISLDTVSQKLVSNGWMSVLWHNDFMSWRPEHYQGVRYIVPQPERLWRPRVSVLNTIKDLKPIGEDYVVLHLFSTGTVIWYPAERFETFCQVDVTYFPFDIQRCRWEIFGWAEDASEIVLRPVLPHIDLDSFQENGEWRLMSSRAWEETIFFDGVPFSQLNYEVTLRRRPILLALTVLLPVFVQSLINVFVFTIPSEAGERMAYSMTSFLSFGVFMSFIVDLMPSSAESVSIMAACLSSQLALSALYVLLCILSLKLFHRDSRKHPVPSALQTLIVCLEMMVCLDPPSRQPRPDVQTQVDVISLGRSGDFYGAEVKQGSRLRGHLDRWARKRQVKQEAYTQPQDMTWQRVSRTVDKLFFRFFLCLVIVCSIVIVVFMTSTSAKFDNGRSRLISRLEDVICLGFHEDLQDCCWT